MPRSQTHTSVGALLPLLLVACGAAPSGAPGTSSGSSTSGAVGSSVIVDGPAARAFGVASNALGLDLWGQLRSDHGGNLAISPASISSALAMTYGGARGTTAAAMAATMHLNTTPEEALETAGSILQSWNDPSRADYELAVANRLYGEHTHGFAPAFLAATREHFGAELESVDFVHAFEPARVGINRWVAGMTHDRIPEILPPGTVTDTTRLVLVNAVYFHGQWAFPFERDATFDAPFHTTGGSDVMVPTMHRIGGWYGEDEHVSLYRLPYAGNEVSMLFVLPRDADGLPALEASLNAAMLDRWLSLLADNPDVQVSIPRFGIETDVLSLRAPLEALGMAVAFGAEADFSGMSLPDQPPLGVSDVLHRVVLELNEEGTVAAAATAVVLVEESVREAPFFTADRPFLFFLLDDRTGALLFMGRLADPA